MKERIREAFELLRDPKQIEDLQRLHGREQCEKIKNDIEEELQRIRQTKDFEIAAPSWLAKRVLDSFPFPLSRLGDVLCEIDEEFKVLIYKHKRGKQPPP